MKNILILSFSGGGIRGYLSALVVQELQKRVPFLHRVDLFAGTSTGAVLAAWFAKGEKQDPAQAVALYRDHASRIFRRSVWSDIKSVFGYYQARYDPDYLSRILTGVFGDSVLRSLVKPVLIPAQDLGDNYRPYQAKYFDNFKANTMDLDIRIVDVLLASAAAPTYFRSHAITFKDPFGKREFMDGGLNCNHPCVSAVAACTDWNGFNADIRNVYCLHIATGYFPKNALGWRDRGAAQLVKPIIDMATEHYSTATFQADRILKNRFCCIGTRFEEEIEMDDPKAIEKLDRHWPRMEAVLGAAELYLNNFMRQEEGAMTV